VALRRVTKGLLLYDDFSTDTEANYEGNHAYFAVSGGAMVSSGVPGDVYLCRADIFAAKVMTCRAKSSSWTANYQTPCVVGGSDVYGTFMPSGYIVQLESTADQCYISCYPNGGSGAYTIQSAVSVDLTDDTYCLWRLYIHGGRVYLKQGATALVSRHDEADATHTAGHIGINAYAGTCSWDWVEARTSQLISCTSMPPGAYLRVSDGTTTAEAQAVGGTATVDAGLVLFPLTSVQVRTASGGGGSLIAEITSATLTDMGGGDVFAITPTLAAVQDATHIDLTWS